MMKREKLAIANIYVPVKAARTPPVAAIKATFRRMSAAASRNLAFWLSPQRYSIATFDPSAKPLYLSPCAKAAAKGDAFREVREGAQSKWLLIWKNASGKVLSPLRNQRRTFESPPLHHEGDARDDTACKWLPACRVPSGFDAVGLVSSYAGRVKHKHKSVA
jgi:hypothetical protein